MFTAQSVCTIYNVMYMYMYMYMYMNYWCLIIIHCILLPCSMLSKLLLLLLNESKVSPFITIAHLPLAQMCHLTLPFMCSLLLLIW